MKNSKLTLLMIGILLLAGTNVQAQRGKAVKGAAKGGLTSWIKHGFPQPKPPTPINPNIGRTGGIVPTPNPLLTPTPNTGKDKRTKNEGFPFPKAKDYLANPNPVFPILSGWSIKPLSVSEQAQYIHSMLIPSLLDTADIVVSTNQIQDAKDLLRSVITKTSLLDESVYLDLVYRYDALITYALLSDDAQAVVDMAKRFLTRGYGPLSDKADNAVIEACLMIGEAGWPYLRELAKQRLEEGLRISLGWKTAKEMILDLDSSNSLKINEYIEEINPDRLARLIEARTAVQKRLKTGEKPAEPIHITNK